MICAHSVPSASLGHSPPTTLFVLPDSSLPDPDEKIGQRVDGPEGLVAPLVWTTRKPRFHRRTKGETGHFGSFTDCSYRIYHIRRVQYEHNIDLVPEDEHGGNLGGLVRAALLTSHGFEVLDLGIDVLPETFVQAAESSRPDIIGISILMTNALDSMKDAILRIRSSRVACVPEIPVVIGGSLADPDVCSHVRADYWVNDAMEGVRICLKLMAGHG